ncbi:MAG: hypothetical protein GY850_23740 [bacterium]|nr:hypothetical protein [bacterium]
MIRKQVCAVSLLTVLCVSLCCGCRQGVEAERFSSPNNGFIAWDGDRIWITNGTTGIWKVDSGGYVDDYFELEQYDNSSVSGIAGLTFAGGNPAILYLSERIVLLDDEWKIEHTIDLPQPCDPVCLTNDGEAFWYGDSFNEKLVCIDRDGHVLKTVSYHFKDCSLGGLAAMDDGIWVVYNYGPIGYDMGTHLMKIDREGAVLENIQGPWFDSRACAVYDGNLILGGYDFRRNEAVVYLYEGVL